MTPVQVLIDQRWLDHEGKTLLYHPACIAKIAKFYKMPNPSLRYKPYGRAIPVSATCDFCSRSLLPAQEGQQA